MKNDKRFEKTEEPIEKEVEEFEDNAQEDIKLFRGAFSRKKSE